MYRETGCRLQVAGCRSRDLLLIAFILFFSIIASAEEKKSAGTNTGVAAAVPQMSDIHDIKAPEEIGIDLRLLYYILPAALIAALLVLAIFYMKRRKIRLKEKETIKLPPDEAAYLLLDELSDIERIDGKEFYFRLSAILRTYIQERYGIAAPEMTTEEFLPQIEKLALSREMQNDLRKLLCSADPVKFAGMPAVQTEMQSDLNYVRLFIKQTTEPSTQYPEPRTQYPVTSTQ